VGFSGRVGGLKYSLLFFGMGGGLWGVEGALTEILAVAAALTGGGRIADRVDGVEGVLATPLGGLVGVFMPDFGFIKSDRFTTLLGLRPKQILDCV
jgi:hypothetical protein